MPRMDARTRMSGLRPHHLPSPVRVWELFARRSLYDSRERRAMGNWVSMNVGIYILVTGNALTTTERQPNDNRNDNRNDNHGSFPDIVGAPAFADGGQYVHFQKFSGFLES